MLNSLIGRLMAFSTLTLIVLMTGLGFLLQHSFYSSQLSAMQERLKLHSYSILSVADYHSSQLYLPVFLQERRFNKPESGLYAQVVKSDATKAWSSLSARSLSLGSSRWAEQGQWIYSTVARTDEQFFMARFGVSWSESGISGPVYNIVLLESMSELHLQVDLYRQKLGILLLSLSSFILLMQFLILRWGLRPLRQVSSDLEDIQHGQKAQLSGDYPRELKPLTSNLNRLISSEHGQRERYRNTLADLSHSLKTPLTVMSGIVTEQQQHEKTVELNELCYQIDKMNSTIGYQLQRAVQGSSGLSIQKIDVLPLLQSVCSAMDKVYANKGMAIHLDVSEPAIFNGDENDLLEVLGNLVDNACKYGNQTVEIAVFQESQQLTITVSDDGRGIPEEQRNLVLQRGRRLDTVEAGQGLGLALVKEILDSYRAGLIIEQSPLGGACFRITFPQ
ncbi:MAG: ATP-binding protein [Saccharospirillaceae bacterium]|nr:hypothetical protein A3759_01960 [Thalassolituus sp. HI0120]MCH2041280.1 ATP-binding protein [Saccharospirillaceae bacterium]